MSISIPYARFPSLNALRAFEAAARLESFVQAAGELCVTPGAVAAQIKALEQECGAALFERHARGVRLTPLGESVRPGFVAAFDALGLAVHELRRKAAPRRVHIVSSPALTQLWLSPRLPRLRALLPGVDISLSVFDNPPELKRSPFDIALFYLAEPGPHQVALFPERLMPVCIPEMAAGLRAPEDLRKVVCIRDVVWEDWRIWTRAAMPGSGFMPDGPGFSLYALAVQEALNGVGMLMARRSLVERHLQSGALVAPFDLQVPLGLTVTAWALPESAGNDAIREVIAALRRIGGDTEPGSTTEAVAGWHGDAAAKPAAPKERATPPS